MTGKTGKKDKKQKSTDLAVLINSSVNSQLNHSDLVGLVMEEQSNLWESELATLNVGLAEKNQKISTLEKMLVDALRRYFFEISGINNIINPDDVKEFKDSGYSQISISVLFNEKKSHDTNIKVTGVSEIGRLSMFHELNIPSEEIKEIFKIAIEEILTERKLKLDLIHKIVELENKLSNRDRMESKIKASITKNILGSMENGKDIVSNMESIRKSIFEGNLLT